jgi:hypothetical protein
MANPKKAKELAIRTSPRDAATAEEAALARKRVTAPRRPGLDATSYWCDFPSGSAGNALVAHVNRLKMTNAVVHQNNLMMRHLYNDFNTPIFGNTPQAIAYKALEGSVSHNVVGSAIKSVAAQVFKDPPRVRVITEKGNGKMQRTAAKLTQFMDGVLDEGGLRTEAPRAGLDALICHFGALHVYNDCQGNPCVERLWPNEVLVDLNDSDRMHPTEMFRLGRTSREDLTEQFPDLKDEIAQAMPSVMLNSPLSTAQTFVPNVGVVEAWKLPTPGTDDGRHIIACSTCTLLDEPYDLPFFPIKIIRWDEDQLSFFGSSIAWQLQQVQELINRMINIWCDDMMMLSMARIAMEEGAVIPENQMSNPGGILTYANGHQPPVALNFPVSTPDFVEWLNAQHQWAYQYVGLNEGAVNAGKPADLGSGTALREYRDNQSQRLSAFCERWDRLHVEVAETAIELTRRWTQKNGEFKKQVRGRQFLQEINWKDCSIDQNAYSIAAFATNDLPRTPAGRTQKVNELSEAGLLDRETMLDLLDMPDVDAVTNRMTSDALRLDLIIEKILDDNVYTAPDEFLMMQNPTMILSVAVQEINQAYCNNEDDVAIQMLERFFNDALSMLKLANDLKAKMTPPPGPPISAGQPVDRGPLNDALSVGSPPPPGATP